MGLGFRVCKEAAVVAEFCSMTKLGSSVAGVFGL